MARKSWMKSAVSYKWSRDGLMTAETAKAQKKADASLPGVSDMRCSVLYSVPDSFKHEYATNAVKPFHKLTADELFDMSYAFAWCAAYGKTLSEYRP